MPGKIRRKTEQKVVEFTQALEAHRASSDGDKISPQESTYNMLPVSSQNKCNPPTEMQKSESRKLYGI